MKKIFIVLSFFLSLISFSQGLTLEINTTTPLRLENGKIYQNDTQIPSFQLKKIFASNLRSYHLFKRAKSKEALGGALLAIGSTLCVIDLALGLKTYPTGLSYAGLGAVAISIPILSGRSKKIEEAVNTYNTDLKKTSFLNRSFNFNCVANKNGIGVEFKF
jgi:hypothetical protein